MASAPLRLAAAIALLALAACNGSTQPSALVPDDGTRAADANPPATAPADRSQPTPAPVDDSAGNASGPRRFDADDQGDPAAVLPEAIARGLQTDELVLSCDTGVVAGSSQFRPDWVGVRRIDLNGDGRRDWVVNGLHDCLSLPDAGYWWVYQATAEGPRQVLRAELGAALEVLRSSHHGFRDLRFHLVNGRGAELVADNHYDGRTYVPGPADSAPADPVPADPVPNADPEGRGDLG